jgi:hypothetical protein
MDSHAHNTSRGRGSSFDRSTRCASQRVALGGPIPAAGRSIEQPTSGHGQRRLTEYAVPNVMDDDLRRSVEESRQRLAAMSPEQNLAAARLARHSMPRLATDRQRELAEEAAKRFEERAAAHISSSPRR